MSTYTTVDEYVKAQPEMVANRLLELRKLFKLVMPDTVETISYDMPSYTVGAERLYFGAYKGYIGFYPVNGLPQLEDELAPFRAKNTKDALHFKHDEPLPVKLIVKIIYAKSRA